jgi:hypothetical protein
VNAFEGLTTLPDTVIEILVLLLQDPDEDVRSKAANTLGSQTTLPHAAIEGLVLLPQGPSEEVRFEAATALRRQTTLPNTAIEAVIRLLQTLGNSVNGEVFDLITSRQEIRTWVPEFGSSALKHLIEHWFRTASMICFFEKGCFSVLALE